MISEFNYKSIANVSQNFRNLNDNKTCTGGIRMPRTHDLRLPQDETSIKSSNESQKRDIRICMHCQTTLSEIFVLEDDQFLDKDNFCYLCGVEVLAQTTVNRVLKKVSRVEYPPKIVSESDIIVEKKRETDIHNCLNESQLLQNIQNSESIICSCQETKKDSEHQITKSSAITSTEKNNSCIDKVVSETELDCYKKLNQIKTTININTKCGKVPKVKCQNSSNSQNSLKFNDDQDSPISCRAENHFELKISNTPLSELYSIIERIGGGRFGKVSKVVHKETKQTLAVKCIAYRNMETRKQILNEIQILSSLHGNEHILQLVEVIDNDISKPKCINIITEYLEGGELYEQIAKDELLNEDQVINIMYQLLDGVNFIHDHGIIHRDIKPENIVFTSKNSGHLKIIDFGFAIKFDDKSPPKTMVGTTVFVAPEVLRYESQSYLTDMWSIGVVAFNLLTGITPFEIPLTGDLSRQLTDIEIIENIERCQYNFDDEGFIDVSEEAKDFISSLLIRNPSMRLTAKQCLKHKWLLSCHKAKSSISRSITLQRMKNYVAIQKWQKIGIVIQSINHFKNAIMSSS